MEKRVLFYTSQIVMATLYRKQFNRSEIEIFTDWDDFLKRLYQLNQGIKILVLDVERLEDKFRKELELFYFDINTYFIFLLEELDKTDFLPFNYFYVEKKEGIEKLSHLLKMIEEESTFTTKLEKFDFAHYFDFLARLFKEDKVDKKRLILRVYLMLENLIDKSDLKNLKEKVLQSSLEKVPQEEEYYLKEREFKCPVCQNLFKEKVLDKKRIVLKKKYFDYFEEYEGVNHLFYQLVGCPECFFTFLEKDYPFNFHFLVVDKLKKDIGKRRELAALLEIEEMERKIRLWEVSYSHIRPAFFKIIIALYRYWYERHLKNDPKWKETALKIYKSLEKIKEDETLKKRFLKFLPQINFDYFYYLFGKMARKTEGFSREKLLEKLQNEDREEEIAWLKEEENSGNLLSSELKEKGNFPRFKINKKKDELIELL